MRSTSSRFAAIGLIILAGALPARFAHADRLDQARDRLDAANAAAKRHQAAAAAAENAAAAVRKRRDALVQQEIAANAQLRGAENQTATIAAKLADLQAKAGAAKTELDADAAAIAPLLPLITRLALHPAATLLAADALPGRAATGALAMQGITRIIGTQALALRAARQRYAALSAELSDQRAKITASLARQSAKDQALQADIATVTAEASKAAARHVAELRAAEAAATRATDLAGVIKKLQSQRKAETVAAAARVPANLPHELKGAPVAGSLVRAFASVTPTGKATGDTFAAAPGAVVSAACSGRVVFAKPFASYGKLLILDCSGGYDFVMAGFERFDVSVGQHVEAGQPVGRMPKFDPQNPGNQPRLYVELRHAGKAIDPAGHFGMASAGH